MSTLSQQRESNSIAPHKPDSAGLTPVVATISGDKRRANAPQTRDELGGVLRPRNFEPRIVNGPVNGGGKPWFTVRNGGAPDVSEILIYNQIGEDWYGQGTNAEDFVKALGEIPPTNTLHVRINSPGGNVFDGLAIHNALLRWKGRVDTFNDGWACSIASVILLSAVNGGKIHAAKASGTMIHEASTVASGTKRDMDKAKSALENAEKNIISVYAQRSGKSEAELIAAMEKETWFTGPEAMDFGFVDEVTESEPLQNSFDISNFRRVPETFRKMQNSAAQGGGQLHNKMDKATIIALLKEHGVEVDDKSTLEQLQAKLKECLAKAKQPEPKPASDSASAIAEIKAQLAAEKKTRITSAVKACVEERRIPAAQQDAWIADCLRDETILARLQSMPQVLDDNTGLRVECVSESSEDISRHIVTLGNGINRMAKGEVDDRDLGATIKAKSMFVVKHLDKLCKILNEGSNTIPSQLKIDVLLQQAIVQFKRAILPLLGFNRNVGAIPLRGTTNIQVPFIPNDTATSTTWNAANGYVAGDTTVDYRTLTLTRYYKAIRFTADELRRQPFLMLNETFMKAVDQLIYDVWLGFLAVITAASYNATVLATDGVTKLVDTGVPQGWPKAPGAFDSNSVIDLRNGANMANWPAVGRKLIVNSDYDTALLKDNAIKNAYAFGNSAAVQDGRIVRLLGFDYGVSPNQPTNGEKLVGFIAQEDAILVGASPIAPTEEELLAGLQYQVASDPDLGISLEYKNFGQPQMNRAFRIVEANWAAGKGNEKNLFRLTSP